MIGRAEHDITADVRDALTPTETQHFAAITEPRRAGELLRAIDSYPGQPSTAYALRLAPHLFVRPGKLRFAEWREFDFNAAEWGIPAEKMKMDDYHLDPLSRQVIAIPGPTTWTACETERMCCASGEPAELGSLILCVVRVPIERPGRAGNCRGRRELSSLINTALREHMKHKFEPLEATLRRVLREELRTAG